MNAEYHFSSGPHEPITSKTHWLQGGTIPRLPATAKLFSEELSLPHSPGRLGRLGDTAELGSNIVVLGRCRDDPLQIPLNGELQVREI